MVLEVLRNWLAFQGSLSGLENQLGRSLDAAVMYPVLPIDLGIWIGVASMRSSADRACSRSIGWVFAGCASGVSHRSITPVDSAVTRACWVLWMATASPRVMFGWILERDLAARVVQS